jgi:hypothetical protein
MLDDRRDGFKRLLLWTAALLLVVIVVLLTPVFLTPQ